MGGQRPGGRCSCGASELGVEPDWGCLPGPGAYREVGRRWVGGLGWSGSRAAGVQAAADAQLLWSLMVASLSTYPQGDNVHEPDYGCKAVHAEWEWSGRRSLLARQCMQDLVRTVEVRAAGCCRCCPPPPLAAGLAGCLPPSAALPLSAQAGAATAPRAHRLPALPPRSRAAALPAHTHTPW